MNVQNRRTPLTYRPWVFWIAALVVFAPGPAAPSGSMVVSNILRSRLTLLQTNGRLMVGGESIVANRVLTDIYAQSHGEARWLDASTASQLMAAIRSCTEDGLRPQDYHLAALSKMVPLPGNGIADPHFIAERDLLLTDALVRLAFHLYYGKVNPRSLNPRWQVPPTIGYIEAASLINRQIEASGVARFVERLRPDHPHYRRLRQALSIYRQIAAAGGWDRIPEGPLIEKGDRDSRVPLIRMRLRHTGDLPESSNRRGDRFDLELENAVARFQDRHGITFFDPGSEDRYGAVGMDTLDRMNLPADHLVDRIRINLERARWILHHLPDRYVLADIAGFDVKLVEGGRRVWTSRAQVGDVYRKTPVFSSSITYMEVNPTWTVPPGILDDSILPEIRALPRGGWLDRFALFDRRGNRIAHPERIDWHRYTGATLPYRLVQPPGPSNPVGRIKFIFPNPDFVFMHDTPEKAFFDLERRDLSAGCVRIEQPFALARHLLRLDGQSGRDRLATALKSGKTIRIHFKRPLPVILFYGTVSVESRGEIVFREDVYDRDSKLLKALDAPARLWNTGGGS